MTAIITNAQGESVISSVMPLEFFDLNDKNHWASNNNCSNIICLLINNNQRKIFLVSIYWEFRIPSFSYMGNFPGEQFVLIEAN